MYIYTICFIQHEDRILLLNRNRKPEMGLWNGVGGKIDPGETPEECILREVEEETGIKLSRAYERGAITWIGADGSISGMYIFWGDFDKRLTSEDGDLSPRMTEEGILDWKTLDWIGDPYNQGMAHKVAEFLPYVLRGEVLDHRYTYNEANQPISCERVPYVSAISVG